MTEKETIEHVIATRKFPRGFDDYAAYFFLVAPIAFVAMGLSLTYNYFKFHTGLHILLLSILFVFLGILFAFFVLSRLDDNITFKSISATTNDNMDNVAERLNQKLKLRSVDVNKELNTIVAFTKVSAFSWGEQVTLIFDKDCILVNSRPSGSTQPFTIMKDRQNIKRLEQIL